MTRIIKNLRSELEKWQREEGQEDLENALFSAIETDPVEIDGVRLVVDMTNNSELSWLHKWARCVTGSQGTFKAPDEFEVVLPLPFKNQKTYAYEDHLTGIYVDRNTIPTINNQRICFNPQGIDNPKKRDVKSVELVRFDFPEKATPQLINFTGELVVAPSPELQYLFYKGFNFPQFSRRDDDRGDILDNCLINLLDRGYIATQGPRGLTLHKIQKYSSDLIREEKVFARKAMIEVLQGGEMIASYQGREIIKHLHEIEYDASEAFYSSTRR
jgi:hypothetical protein